MLISGWPMRHPRDSRVAASAFAGARAACRSASSCLRCCNAAASFASTSCANRMVALAQMGVYTVHVANAALMYNSSCGHADLQDGCQLGDVVLPVKPLLADLACLFKLLQIQRCLCCPEVSLRAAVSTCVSHE